MKKAWMGILFAVTAVFAGNKTVILTQNGDFSQYSHFTFFIDSDNNPDTGYSNWKIKGADFLVQENGLYRYPKGAKGWKWERVSKVPTVTHTTTSMRSEIPLSLLDGYVADRVNYNASVSTKNWKKNRILSRQSIKIVSNRHTDKGATLPIVIIGPSTVYIAHANHEAVKADRVTDCRLEGWGEQLYVYATDKDAVYNYARPGSNHNSFQMSPDEYVAFLIQEGQIRTDTPAHQRSDERFIRNLFGPDFDHYWERAKEKMQSLGKGILLMQFGGSNEDRISGNEHRFKENLRLYIEEARDLNFTPVFVTDIEKRIRNADGSLVRSRGEFPKWMKEVAKEEGVRVLDLNAKSYREYSRLSDAQWDARFGNCYGRWNGRKETTHFEPKGAKVVAGWIRELACEEQESKLCRALGGIPESF